MNTLSLDFEQARAKHLLFKSRLRALLYGVEVDEKPVVSHFECDVGKWIYGHALNVYGHLPEMLELEKVHADIHHTAKRLVILYREGKVDESRNGLTGMELQADRLVELLQKVEKLTDAKPVTSIIAGFDATHDELQNLLKANIELDIRIKDQVQETQLAKNRFELLAKATQDAVWDWDLITNEIWWNDGFCNLFGYTKEDIELDSGSWYNRLHPDDNDRVLNDIHRVIDSGGSNWSAEYRFLKADGTYAFVFDRGYCLHTNEGKACRMVGSMVDITDRIKSEQAIRDSEKRFRFMAETIPQKVFTATPTGEVDYFNPQWTELTGLSFEEIKEWGWVQFIHPDDVEENIRLWKYSIDTGEPFQCEHRFKTKDGNYRWHLSRARPLRDETGSIIMWSGSNTDIDDRKHEEERKDEFISIASHELKTPLTGIKAFNQILLKNITSEKDLRFLKKQGDQIERLESLVSDLLNVSKINAGKLNYNVAHFNFQDALIESIESVQHMAETHNIILEGFADVIIQGDRLRIEQVINNFLTNAIKYSPDSDKVIVRAGLESGSPVVSIQDFGIGIAEENLAHIFDRFYRVDNSNAKFQGLGLGLYIASEILKRHNGSFWIESRLGEGSTFFFRLPVNDERVEKAAMLNRSQYEDSTIKIKYVHERGSVEVDWLGYQTLDSVKKGCLQMLDILKANRASKVLNDNTNVLGTWSEAAEWVGEEWFPMIENAGLKYFAWIYSPSTFSKLSAQKSIDVMVGSVTTQLFTNRNEAENWLHNII